MRGWRMETLCALSALHLYGAAGIAAFGWALARLLDFSCARFAPLWFAGGLLVYNLDRLKRDPADAFNTPERLRRHSRLRPASFAFALAAAAVLIIVPMIAADWLLLFLVLCAACVSLSYSFPILGFRFKDVPLVKTLFAPGIVLLAFLVPALLARELRLNARVLSAAAWSGSLLLFNMVLCDLRDIAGDRAHHTQSIPVFLGEKKTMLLLIALLAAGLGVALANGWMLLGCASAAYLAALLLALRKPRGEIFYEWFVEGILFLPAAVEFGKHLAHRLPV